MNSKSVAWLQSLNIIIFFAIAFRIPYEGPILMFFGGFFILFVQMPLFFFLLYLQVYEAIQHYKQRTLSKNKNLIIPAFLFVSLWVLAFIADYFHLFDPFYHDHYNIRVELFTDGSCEIWFEGHLIGESSVFRYDWFGSDAHSVSCNDNEISGTDVNLYFEQHIGNYPIVDPHGGFAVNGGALFDSKRLEAFTPGFHGRVYWEFVDGNIQVLEVTPPQPDKLLDSRSPHFHVVVTAIGKRMWRGL